MPRGHPGGDEGRDHRTGAVDVVGAPAAEPAAARLLFGQQPGDAASGPGVRRPALEGEHLHHVGGDVGRGRVDDLAEVAEGQLVRQGAGVVGVEGAPRPVPRLHAEVPGHPAGDGALDPGRVGVLDAAQGEDHLGRVVDVGVGVVVELERPAAGGEAGPAHGPVARADDLLAEHPVGGLDQRRMVGAQSRVGQGDRGEAGVPHRGLAGLDHPGAVRAPHREPLQGLQTGAHHRMSEVVAEQVQGDDRVHGGRLDPAPAAVVLLPFDDPAARARHRRLAQAARCEAPVDVQGLVHPLEGAVPAGQRGESPGGVGGTRVGVQLVEGEGAGRTGRSAETTVSGTMVWRAQQPKS